MLKKLIVVVVLSLVTALFLVSGAMAAKLLCVRHRGSIRRRPHFVQAGSGVDESIQSRIF
jgi:hypothetical protein